MYHQGQPHTHTHADIRTHAHIHTHTRTYAHAHTRRQKQKQENSHHIAHIPTILQRDDRNIRITDPISVQLHTSRIQQLKLPRFINAIYTQVQIFKGTELSSGIT